MIIEWNDFKFKLEKHSINKTVLISSKNTVIQKSIRNSVFQISICLQKEKISYSFEKKIRINIQL